MINVMKMDLYRMFRSKSTYLILLGILTFVGITLYTMRDSIGMPNVGVTIGITTNTDGLRSSTDLTTLFKIMASSNSFLIGIVIFSVMFINREEASGFTKNIVGQVTSKGLLVLSKFVSQCVFIVLSFIGSLFIFFFIGNVIFDSVSLGNSFDLIKETSLQFIFHVAFAAIVLGLITLIQQPVVSMLIGILLTFGGFSYLYQMINNIIHGITGNQTFDLMNYTITGIVPSISGTSPVASIIRGIAVSFVFIVLMLTYSVTIKQKRDVNG
ncbi:ABC transporter permease subunit [Enterococcus crotali]|uniref:ABC transporter permease subunit n=1 Tax=Enterococcus crotali TaxID=1453587 RepID=UPI00046FE388|nr:ABC transporter permease [Enterococcus crotali]